MTRAVGLSTNLRPNPSHVGDEKRRRVQQRVARGSISPPSSAELLSCDVQPAIDLDARTSRKSSIFLGRIISGSCPPQCARAIASLITVTQGESAVSHARTRPSLTPASRAYACAYLARTPTEGGGPVGGFLVGVTQRHRESIWRGACDDAVSYRAALVPGVPPHRQ
jgi:hypothetical protein